MGGGAWTCPKVVFPRQNRGGITMQLFNYTYFFIAGIIIQVIVTILLYFWEQKRKSAGQSYEIIHVFFYISAFAVFWLVVSFIAQILMGWISF